MKPFLAFTLCCAIACGTMPLAGCNSQAVLNDVEKFEPVVLNALTLACTINAGLAVCGTMQTTITNDYNLVIKLWQDWITAKSNGTATLGLWNDLNAAFSVFEQDSAAIFAAASGLNAPEVTAIVAAAQVLLAAIEALSPAAPSGSAAPSAVFKSSRAASFDLQAWVTDYNERVDVARHLHPTAKLTKVHYHGKALRIATFGIAQ
jgi:hypothetical protein